jgi:chromosome segregation ATPase
MRKKYTIHKKRKYIKKNKIKKSNNKIKYTKKKYKEKTKRKQRGGAEEDINGMDNESLRQFIIEQMDQIDEKDVQLEKASAVGKSLLAKIDEFEIALETLQIQKDVLEEQRNTLESERNTLKFENNLITDLLGNVTSFQDLEDRLREAEESYSSQELPVWFHNIQDLNATHNDNDIEMLIVELTAERDDCMRQYDELSRSIDTREGDLENEKKLFEVEKGRLLLELESKSDDLDAERTELFKKIEDDRLVLKSRKTQLSEAAANIAQLEQTQHDLIKKQEGDAENSWRNIRNISGCLGEINHFIKNLEGLTQ